MYFLTFAVLDPALRQCGEIAVINYLANGYSVASVPSFHVPDRIEAKRKLCIFETLALCSKRLKNQTKRIKNVTSQNVFQRVV